MPHARFSGLSLTEVETNSEGLAHHRLVASAGRGERGITLSR